MACNAPLKINSLKTNIPQVLLDMSEGNPGALSVIFKSQEKASPMFILLLDSKHLYGPRIQELYKDVCGEDIDRFIYHVSMELPCQACGELSITGPYSTKIGEENEKEFWASRKYGKPGSFWALANPPRDTNYKYPIIGVSTTETKKPEKLKN